MGNWRSYEIGEVVSSLPHPEPLLVPEPGDEVDVGLHPGRVGLEADVDEAGQELVSGGGRVAGDLEHLEDALAAGDQGGQLVVG